MIDRSLLALLLITTLFIFLVKPHGESIDLLRNRIAVLDAQIAAQENLKRFKADAQRRISNVAGAATRNEGYLFPATESDSVSLVELQDQVKDAARTGKMEFLSSNWGEPFSQPETGVTKLPLSFVVRGTPGDVNNFLRKMLFGQRLVKVERAGISKYQDQLLVLNLSIVAYKLNRGKQ